MILTFRITGKSYEAALINLKQEKAAADSNVEASSDSKEHQQTEQLEAKH